MGAGWYRQKSGLAIPKGTTMMMGLRNIGSLSASLRSLRYALISAFIVLGASCGGGGGGGGGGFLPNDGNGNLTSFAAEQNLHLFSSVQFV